MQEQAITKNDLKQLNRFTLKEMTTNDVAVYSMRVIDSHKTSNNRVWEESFLKTAVENNLFDGTPFLVDHNNSLQSKIGTIFSATFDEGAVHAKVFIPRDERGEKWIEQIENGTIRQVSINASSSNVKDIDGTLHIYPSDDMRVFEISGVATGGCGENCRITEQAQTETPSESGETDDSQTSLIAFAESELAILRNQFIRLAGFTLGTSNRETYSKVADALDPLTLKAFCEDLRKAYENAGKCECQETGTTESETSDDVLKALKEINKYR